MSRDFNLGDSVIVVEKTIDGDVFEWSGIVTQVNKSFIETKHARNPITHPQWSKYPRAYSDTWTKHYCLDNIKK